MAAIEPPSSTAPVANNPAQSKEDQVREFLDQHVWPQVKWYWDEAERFERSLATWTWVGIGAGILATILAAFPKNISKALLPFGDELFGWFVVIASATAAAATGTLVPRYRRLATLREAGRVKTTLLSKVIHITMLNVPMTPEQRIERFTEFARELMAIEAEHGTVDHGTESTQAGHHPSGPAGNRPRAQTAGT